MLGFGKKKKKDKKKKESSNKDAPEKKKKGKDDPKAKNASEKKKSPGKLKKLFSKKIIFILLLVFIALGASSYIVYTKFFANKTVDGQKTIYTKIELKHINLPEEMLRFSFDYLPELYGSMITFNREIDLFDMEIARIDAIAQQYPDQKKITDKEKKIWEKAKNTLQKTFLKIEKPVKETYVLFRVNKKLGLSQIETKRTELNELTLTALKTAQELTQKLESTENVPKGIIKGNIYKLKKKFL